MARIVRGKVVAREVHGAKAEADVLLREAKEKCEALLENAKRDAEALHEQARLAGHREGRAEAAALVAAAAARRDAILVEAEASLIELAMGAAAQVVGDIVKQSPEVVRERVKTVLERARRATRVMVHVHPEDLPFVAELTGVTIEADPSLARGDCVVVTDLGSLDARISTQLDSLRKALLKP